MHLEFSFKKNAVKFPSILLRNLSQMYRLLIFISVQFYLPPGDFLSHPVFLICVFPSMQLNSIHSQIRLFIVVIYVYIIIGGLKGCDFKKLFNSL